MVGNMDVEQYKDGYKALRDRLNKRQITDSYIDNSADSFMVIHWDGDVYREVIKDLSLDNPYKADISAGNIRSLYYQKIKIKSGYVIGVLKECKYKLCDGAGLIMTTIQHDFYPYPTEAVFRCKCMMGQNHSDKISMWSDDKHNKGYRINRDMVYLEETTDNYETMTYVAKTSEAMGMD